MKKPIAILVIALLFGLGGIYAYSSGSARKQSTKQQKSQIDKREQSRKVYKGLGNQYGPKIPEAAAKAEGDIKTEREVGQIGLQPFAPPFNLHDWLKGRGCDADAVIIATIKSADSSLTEDESFIYTNHNVTVEDVLKNNPASAIRTDDTVTITRTGGSLTLFGKKVSAIDKNALPLKLSKRYLLFLTYIPERGTYVADNIAYLLENNKVVRTTMQPAYPAQDTGNDASAFIKAVRDALAEPCPNTQGGAQ